MSARPLPSYNPAEPVRRLRADLYHCMVDGLLYCLMVGLGESFIPAFVMRLGLGPIAAGLVLTAPVVVGAWAQLLAPTILQRFGSYVRFVWVTALLQAAMYVPLAALAIFWPLVMRIAGEAGAAWAPGALVFACVTLYWIFGMLGAPAWMSMCGKLIPQRVRGGYFGRRLRFLQAATLLGLLAHGGVMTLAGEDPTSRLRASALLFVAAAVMRLGSVWHLSRYTEPAAPPSSEPRFSPQEVVSTLLRGPAGRFVAFAAVAWFAAQIAQPYFNPFMLERLELSPMVYSGMLAAWFFGKGVAQPWMGRFAARRGSLRPLAFAAAGLVPLPVLWLSTSRPEALILFQFVSGVVWGMFDLGLFLQQFETTDSKNRTVVLSCLTAMNETAKTGGSLVGGGILDAGGSGGGAYTWVFWSSAAARVVALLFLIRLRKRPSHPAAAD
ncbi:MAG: MFS transporter [Phycisphaerales bacterium]